MTIKVEIDALDVVVMLCKTFDILLQELDAKTTP